MLKKSKKKKKPKSSNNANNRRFLIIKKILIYFWVSVYGFSSFQRPISGMYRNKSVKKQYQHYFIKYIHVLIVKPNSLFFFIAIFISVYLYYAIFQNHILIEVMHLSISLHQEFSNLHVQKIILLLRSISSHSNLGISSHF